MDQKKHFKVLIVGGSVAGLTVANMLQANEIDFEVLEAYPSIAPQVGASIGLLPHGNRILDQLGLYEKVRNMAPPVDNFAFLNQDGRPVAGLGGTARSFVQRHGFPILFLDRQMLLQVLYDNIRDKTKILTEKRVVKVLEMNEKEVKVATADGSVHSGDIVIGADGIHSTIRGQMRELAALSDPTYFGQGKEEELPCDYSCIFGISDPCPSIKSGTMYSIFRDKSSYLVIGGPGGRIYWFQFSKLLKTHFGSSIPRYSKRDLDQSLMEHADDSILPNLKFATLIKNKITATKTSLPEHVYKKWHFKRIMTIGDSAHKFHPIGGHGGNAAIETAATFVNLLVEVLNTSTSGHATTEQMQNIFRNVQQIRHKRTKEIKHYSHDQQQTGALVSPLRKLKALYLLPFADREDVMYNFSHHIPSSEKLNMFDAAPGPRLIPYKDDLLSPPTDRGPMNWIFTGLYLACALLTYYGMWVQSGSWDMGDKLVDIITTGVFKEHSNFPLKQTYIGVPAIDNYLAFLSVIFVPGLRGWDPRYAAVLLHLLAMLITPLAVWTIEGFRNRNTLTLLAFPSLWFLIFQTTGVGVFMPLYYVAYTWISDIEPYWWPLNRRVPTHHAKVILPACLLGYALPLLLMYIPWKDPYVLQGFEALWQPSPAFVPLLTTILGALWMRRNPQTADEKLTPLASEIPPDLKYLNVTYVVTGVLSALLHWSILLAILFSNDASLSIGSVFIPDFSATPKALGEGFRNLLLADLWGLYIGSYVWCVGAVWDLKRVGRTQTNAFRAALHLLAANVIIGPDAAMAATWYWRESRMARCIFQK